MRQVRVKLTSRGHKHQVTMVDTETGEEFLFAGITNANFEIDPSKLTTLHLNVIEFDADIKDYRSLRLSSASDHVGEVALPDVALKQ